MKNIIEYYRSTNFNYFSAGAQKRLVIILQ